ncbi:NADH/F420H2 dehydrogenase, subunit C [Candidatus Methanoperedens nitroreducens]|uniref:NADH/F420H2 dehydrogenase, subunit C n=1 Tax=Candidatus Methanoperedens nitratireducens TaxID=1392998 RepID=A0A062V7L4_9EURY|nr:NADH-quinone oxidoreductase subunit C [Candidatus Methanoperedens nitroreducens]KCZ72543.1 NADH/F420H2 dehydrogenase, subunit C [Candidatus Methanoperedens nitroreducens]MDJ1423523.1 NADH-quinone oxidoreductase subunit C [Candidatus Methanoperedens sp.]
MNPAEELKQALPGSVMSTGMQVDKPLAVIKKEELLAAAAKVKEMGFDHLSVITGIDYTDRFEVIYNLFSYKKKENLVLKVILDHNNPEVDSLTSLWKGANWLERETYDLVGIKFAGHPNLVRILLPEGWNGHPLRKDYDMDTEQFVTIGEDGEDIVSTDGSNLLRRK